MNIDIEKMVHMYPNNQELGKAIREAYYLSANSTNTMDSLKEIENRNGGQINS